MKVIKKCFLERFLENFKNTSKIMNKKKQKNI